MESFSDGNNARGTLAYPTVVTDPDTNSSYTQYNFDTGAVTRRQDPKGAVATMSYDGAGRIERVTNQVNLAYKRLVYWPDGLQVLSYETIQDGAGELYSNTVMDGAGRVRASAAENPNSVGGFMGQYMTYDAMGRVVERTNPIEIAGRTRDERGRRKRYTKDALGRLAQVDELNWDQSVYATTTYNYNARDQITQINQAGQIRSFAYDGHGRLQSRTTPEQGTTSYSYFADDAVQTVTDARGATTTFSYNNRQLVNTITYGVPAGVAATANVSFAYDSAGNRTSMTDGLGSVTYNYNTLSQMTSETRTFGANSSTLSYAYNLSGELTSITNPWGAQVGYSYDKLGRANAVTGSGYAGILSYVNSIGYRAFGMKQMSYGNGRTLSLQYDNRLRVTDWTVPSVLGWQYSYTDVGENTGRVMFAKNTASSAI